MPSTSGSSFSATHGVSDRVHSHASDMRAPASMPVFSSLANPDILMVQISELTDGCSTLQSDHTQLSGGQRQMGPVAVFSCQTSNSASRPDHLSAATGSHFYIMYFHP